jgi:hypothetical protein
VGEVFNFARHAHYLGLYVCELDPEAEFMNGEDRRASFLAEVFGPDVVAAATILACLAPLSRQKLGISAACALPTSAAIAAVIISNFFMVVP